VVAVEGAVVVWGFRRFHLMMSGRFVPGTKSSRVPAFLRHPIILLPAIVFGSAVFGAGLVLYTNPAGAEALIHPSPGLRNMGLGLLAAMAAYALFAVIYVKKRGITLGTEAVFDQGDATASRILGHPVLNKTLALTTKLTAPLVGKMMVKHYAPVFEQINPGEDQRAQLKDLILKKNAVNMDKGLALMNAKLEAARRAALIAEMKSAREACDAEIRELLGQEDYRVFAQFEQSLPDRLVLDIFKNKLARTGAALSEAQQAQLLQALTEAREQYPWSTDLSRRIQNPADVVAAFSQENIATFAREEEEFDRQFLARAQRTLTAKQLAEFEPFMAKQRAAKIASLKMTSKMFAPQSR
jgi:hypothetical protein